MKKLLLPLTFVCFFVSSSMMAQSTPKNSSAKTTKAKLPKMSKNNSVIRINEVPPTRSVVSRSSNRNTRKQRIIETGNTNRRSLKKVSHREMIAKRKRIVENY